MPGHGARQADTVTPRPDAAMAPRRIVVGVSGATGIVYATRLLEALRQAGTETHLVITPAAGMTRACETDMSAEDLRALADVSYPIGDLTAPISSGSFRTMGMIVAPCSMRSLAEIAYGMTSNLLTRAADVTLKERRRLVLMARETPLSMTHLRAMIAVTESGGIVAPPVPAFYTLPESLDDIVNHTVARLLDLFDIDTGAPRWGDEAAGLAATRAEHNGRKA
jgi:flavin prenyltransferase